MSWLTASSCLRKSITITAGMGHKVHTHMAPGRARFCIKAAACYRHTTLEHYLFTGKNGSMLLALGVGSLFNHNRQPNLDYRVDHDNLIIRYFAAKTVATGEELTIFYGDKLWFEDTSARPNSSLSSGVHDASTLHDHMDNEDTFLGGMTL